MTIRDSVDGYLAFSVPGQERVQICVGDPKNTIEPVGYKLSGVDPAANRHPHMRAIGPPTSRRSRLKFSAPLSPYRSSIMWSGPIRTATLAPRGRRNFVRTSKWLYSPSRTSGGTSISHSLPAKRIRNLRGSDHGFGSQAHVERRKRRAQDGVDCGLRR